MAAESGQLLSQRCVEVVEHMAPSQVAQPRGALGRAHDIDEHHGGEYSIRVWTMVRTGNEFLDLVEEEVQHILIKGLQQMVFTRELDILRPSDVLSQVAPTFDRHKRITLAVEDQGRHVDRRQKVADIDLVIRPHQGEQGPRARCGALEPIKPLDEGLIVAPARRIDSDEDALAPMGGEGAKEWLELLRGHGPWLRLRRRKGAVQY